MTLAPVRAAPAPAADNPLETIMSIITDPIGGIISTFGSRILADISGHCTDPYCLYLKAHPVENAARYYREAPSMLARMERISR